MARRVLGVDPARRHRLALVVAEGNRYRLEPPVWCGPRAATASHGSPTSSGVSRAAGAPAPGLRGRRVVLSGRNPRSGWRWPRAGVILRARMRGRRDQLLLPGRDQVGDRRPRRAEKQQIVYMVTRLLGLAAEPAQDAADAIAVASPTSTPAPDGSR